MERFFIGLHHASSAWPFRNVMISVNTLEYRIRPFLVNDWILDSGSFSQLSSLGCFSMSSNEYATQIKRWSSCGNLLAAVTQDWMCEDFILERTGKTVKEHQELTITSYLKLLAYSDRYIMPVLQGFSPEDYLRHIEAYAELLAPGAWVGVGSVCRRNGNPDAIEDVLLSIKMKRPDLRLHGFGLKITALERPTVRQLLYSSDSMAWSTAGRRKDQNPNDPRRALAYAAQVQSLIKEPAFVQDQLFQWWHEEDQRAQEPQVH